MLSVSSAGTATLPLLNGVAAILIAASSNNMLQAAYATGLAGFRAAVSPALALVLLAAGGLGAAWWIAG